MQQKIKRNARAILCVVLAVTMLVSGIVATNAAWISADGSVGNYPSSVSNVYLVGTFTGTDWARESQYQMSQKTSGDYNDWVGTGYIPYSSTNYYVGVYLGNSSWGNGITVYGDNYWFGTNTSNEHTYYTNNTADQIACISTDSGYIKLDYEYWAKYGNDSKLVISQTAVTALSISNFTAGSRNLQSGDTTTLTHNVTGGSEDYAGSYTVVNKSTSAQVNGAISGDNFIAPSVESTTIYTVTYTATDNKCATLTDSESIDITVNPKPTYAITKGSNNNSYGTVTSVPESVVTEGESVTFTAHPAGAYRLEGWYTDDSFTTRYEGTSANPETNTLTVSNVQAAVAVYAKFVEKDKKTITLNQVSLEDATGTVSLTATNGAIDNHDGTYSVYEGDEVTVTATPTDGTMAVKSIVVYKDTNVETEITSGGSFTATINGEVEVTFAKKHKYAFRVVADSNTTATVTASANFETGSTGAGTTSATVAAGESKKFILGSDATFTISYQKAASGATLQSASLTRKFDEKNDKVWTNNSPGSAATTEAQNAVVATNATYVVTGVTSLGTATSKKLLSSSSDALDQFTDTGLTVYSKAISSVTHYYVVIPYEKMNGTGNKYFAIADGTSYTDMEYKNENDKSTGSVEEGSRSYLSAGKQSKGETKNDVYTNYNYSWVKYNSANNRNSVLLDFYGSTTTEGDTTKYIGNYVYSIYQASAATVSDTFYVGGRFKAYDAGTQTNVFTGAEEDNWSSFSLRLPMDPVPSTNTEYTIDTGLTVSELSTKIDNKYRYFIFHDGTDVYTYNGGDGRSNSFEECLEGNPLPLVKRANKDNSLDSPEELLFNDVEYESDGKVILHFKKDGSTYTAWYTLRDETTALGASLALEADQASVVAGNSVTLTATLATPASSVTAANTEFKLYDDDGTLLETKSATAYDGNLKATFTVTDSMVRTHIYKVVASSKASYGTNGYRSLSKKQTINFTNPDVYMTLTDLHTLTQTQIDDSDSTVTWRPDNLIDNSTKEGKDNTFELALNAGAVYEFALRTTKKFTRTNATQEFYIDPILTKYCDITATSIDKGYTNENGEQESFAIRTYHVEPRIACKNVTLHIDTRAFSRIDATGKRFYYPGKIYGISTYTEDKDSIMDEDYEDETVTYYFAEAATQTDISYKASNSDAATVANGVKIVYWNNSLDDVQTSSNFDASKLSNVSSNETNVTTLVKVKDGKISDAADAASKITVDMSKIRDNGVSGNAAMEFYVYKAELPVWATSFAFLDTNDKLIATKSIKKDGGTYTYSSLLLNPNRVYMLYKDASGSKYVKAVVLDNNLWDSAKKNTVETQGFKANVVNFNKVYNDQGWVTEDSKGANLNKLLSDRVYNNNKVANPLYFGYFSKGWTNDANYNGFNIKNNLAQRNDSENDERYYFASVQGLAANQLDMTQLNSNGFPILQTYDESGNNVNMPLFDYEALASDKSATTDNIIEDDYLGVDFPMYKSTFNGITTYSYDSSTDPNRQLKKTERDGKYYTNFEIGDYVIANTDVGYVPMQNYKTEGEKNLHHWGNATELDIEFYMSNTGQLKPKTGAAQDIVFNFTGDDDVWVYVDGVLVLDLGGAHKASAGSINFSDMKVYYKTAAEDVSKITSVTGGSDPALDPVWPLNAASINVVDMQTRLAAHGVNFNNHDAATKHTFQMFYLERGAFDSNMSISYNLPQASGLNIKNNVEVNYVNPGLKNAALYASNKDYFSYGIANKYATPTELNNVKSVSGYENANSVLATNANALDFATPVYPSSSVTTREFSTKLKTSAAGEAEDGRDISETYILSTDAEAERSSSTPYAPNSSTFTDLNNIVYNLSDTRLRTVEGQEGEATGKITTSGEYNEFHLLGGQAAQFEDKIPLNSLVKVYQTQNLGVVQKNGDAPITFATVANNNVGNYYITSYDIRDEHTGKMIKNKTQMPIATSSNAHLNVSDNSTNTDCFYFSDYSTNETSSAAMTVNFYNEVAVGTIEITKQLQPGQSSDAIFYFDVEFANIFGDDSSVTRDLVGFRDLTYKIKTGNQLDPTTHVYGKTGIALKAGQTAVIEGVPVETRYKVTERAKIGYTLYGINKTITAPGSDTNFIPAHKYAESFDEATIKSRTIRSTSDTSSVVSGDTYYVNMIPTVSETRSGNDYVSTSHVLFSNRKDAVKITFKYFNRSVTSSTAAHIDSSPTSYTVSGALPDELADHTENYNSKIKEALSNMISNAAVEFSDKALTSNVVDDYVMWASQEEATGATGITSKYDLATDPTGKTKYADDTNKQYRKDYIGRDIESPGVNDLWVSYYSDAIKQDSTTKVDAEAYTNGSDALANVKSVIVWLYNTPRQYDIKIYGAESVEQLQDEKTISVNGKNTKVRVAEATTAEYSGKVYYNQRLGKNFGTNADKSTYLEEYKIPGNRADINPEYKTAALIEDSANSKTYTFAYWAYDKNGLHVASADIKFYYRVTTDTKLYAVYHVAEAEDSFNSAAGISVSANANDTYVDSYGASKTRLNVLFNIYNCPDSDPNIQQVALVNINFSDKIKNDPETYTDAKLKELFNKYKDQLKDILKTNSSTRTWNPILNNNPYYNNYGQQSQTIDLTLTTKGYIRNVFGHSAASQYNTATTKLTEKNRIQYTVNFSTGALKDNTCYMMIGAMNYQSTFDESNPNWKISDNCLIYRNGTFSESDLTGTGE